MNIKPDVQIARYIKSVGRRLRLPRELRERVISDFSTSITARIEGGESAQDVLASLGSPKKAASDLNEQMKEYTYRKSPWRFAFLTLGLIGLVGLALWAVSNFTIWYHTTMPHSVAVIGGADGPTSIFVARKIPAELDAVIWLGLTLVGVAGFVLMSLRRPKKR